MFFASGGILFANSSKKYAKTPLETDGFKTSFFVCKSCILNPAEVGNWRISTHAAALLGG